MIRRIWRLLLVLWAGSLWSVGLWVTWILFDAQPDRHLAGVLAARLLSMECYLGLALAAFALLLRRRARFTGGLMAAILLAINEWALKPVMESARVHGSALGLGFGPWHGISAILYIVACLGVAVSVWNEDFR